MVSTHVNTSVAETATTTTLHAIVYVVPTDGRIMKPSFHKFKVHQLNLVGLYGEAINFFSCHIFMLFVMLLNVTIFSK